MRRLALLAAAGAAVSLTLPAGAAPLPPTFATSQVFFHCGATKVANVDQAKDAALPSWNTTPPSASVTTGAGCGWADNSAFRSTQAGNSVHDGAWAGTFTGNLRTLTAKVHSISAGPGRAGGPQTVNATLFVDGESMFGYAADGRANRGAVQLTPVVSSSQASALYEFSITGLPFTTEEGDGTTVHQVVLNLAASTEPMMAWVFDTTEVPSGIVFNPATLAPTRLVATPPPAEEE